MNNDPNQSPAQEGSSQDNSPDQSSDLWQVYAEETNRGVGLDEARATESNAVQVTEGQPFATEQHHVLAQEFEDKFERAGIDADRYTVDLDRDNHQSVLHATDSDGSRNHEWAAFFRDPNQETEQPSKAALLTDRRRG